MEKRHILLTLLILGLIMAPVCAVNVSFSNIDGSGERDILVYAGNATLLGMYNTSSVGINVPIDVMFVMRPHNTNPLENPSVWLTDTAMPFARTHFLEILVIAALIAIALRRS